MLSKVTIYIYFFSSIKMSLRLNNNDNSNGRGTKRSAEKTTTTTTTKQPMNGHDDIFQYNGSLSYAIKRAELNGSLSSAIQRAGNFLAIPQNYVEQDDLVLQSQAREYFPEFTSVALENQHYLTHICETNTDESATCADIRNRLIEAGIQIPVPLVPFTSELPKHIGKRKDPVAQRGHITFVLTAKSDDDRRCTFIKECLLSDLETDDHVYVVMTEQDYNPAYLEKIGLSDLSNISDRLCIIVIPKGVRTAGYTRSWCVYLASILDVTDDTTIWIRDDRRKVVPIKGKRIKGILNKSSLSIAHGTIYSPKGSMSFRKGQKVNPEEGSWCKINQIVCATKKTWRIIQAITTYPQGPILEDYFFSLILYEAGFQCSDLGRKFAINTPANLESIARPGDTDGEIIQYPYQDLQIIELAIQMARGVSPAILLDNATNLRPIFDKEGWASFKIQIGTTKSSWTFTNKPGAQGGGQTHAIAMLYMIQREKNNSLALQPNIPNVRLSSDASHSSRGVVSAANIPNSFELEYSSNAFSASPFDGSSHSPFGGSTHTPISSSSHFLRGLVMPAEIPNSLDLGFGLGLGLDFDSDASYASMPNMAMEPNISIGLGLSNGSSSQAHA
jgi:hypothetical protein